MGASFAFLGVSILSISHRNMLMDELIKLIG